MTAFEKVIVILNFKRVIIYKSHAEYNNITDFLSDCTFVLWCDFEI